MYRGQLEFLEKALGMEFCPLGFSAEEGASVGSWASSRVSFLVGRPAWIQRPWRPREHRYGL